MRGISVTTEDKSELKEEKKWWKTCIENMGNWLANKNKDEWLKDMRGNLSLAATIITTMTFQTAINPPGGVRPATETGHVKCIPTVKGDPCPGEAVLAVVFPDVYIRFLLSNTICFVSSLAVCLLLVSGFPLNHRFFTWLLSICTCITMTSLTVTYMIGAEMVTPYPVWYTTDTMFNKVIYIWFSLLGLVTLVLCLRLFVWIVTKCIDKRKP
ncbi:uncharacterized protein LOC106773737 [Vigna radiata var. radiata]|uniref:Uncharacterized protein LOC106773737 n=1 Tax=Vigna radiata var. radiata TaxID=3916 RepID=A0A1S3VCL9_VIGRR|nr:uncharacterized protein LOC106773737 [Vigna radiata var. radiata]